MNGVLGSKCVASSVHDALQMACVVVQRRRRELAFSMREASTSRLDARGVGRGGGGDTGAGRERIYRSTGAEAPAALSRTCSVGRPHQREWRNRGTAAQA